MILLYNIKFAQLILFFYVQNNNDVLEQLTCLNPITFAQSTPIPIETENKPPTTPRMRYVVISDTYIGPTPENKVLNEFEFFYTQFITMFINFNFELAKIISKVVLK